MALGKLNTACLHPVMEVSDARYHSFLIRIWRGDHEKKGSDLRKAYVFSEDGWLLQVEDIASGERRYFNDIHALTGYVDEKLGTDPVKPKQA